MRILAVSDLHGDLDSVHEAIEHYRPEALVCCGDWGDPSEVSRDAMESFPARLPVLSTFGNHDPMEILGGLLNADGSPVLLEQGRVRTLGPLRLAAIGGIWAKSHRKPFYVTDEDVLGLADRIARRGPLDLLLTHGCPLGMADRTPGGQHGGQRCFLEANKRIAPRVHLCGHLHVAQQYRLKDGREVLNVGATPTGSVVLIEVSQDHELTARLDHFARVR